MANSIFGRALRLVADVLSLGGSFRSRRAHENQCAVIAEYKRLTETAIGLSGQLQDGLNCIGNMTEIAFSQLETAQSILAPLERIGSSRGSVTVAPLQLRDQVSIVNSTAIATFEAIKAQAVGLGLGATTAIGSWTAVSMLGTASTGTPIAILHGAAATKATLAWFGGGSLVSGGAGMAGGTIALGGVVLLPMVVVSAWKSHSEASRIQNETRRIEAANKSNKEAIELLTRKLEVLPPITSKLKSEITVLTSEVTRAQKALFKFGWFSRTWKRIRFHVIGYYYDSKDMIMVEELSRAVDRFISSFKHHEALISETVNKNACKCRPKN